MRTACDGFMVVGRGASVSRRAGQHDDAEKAHTGHAKVGKATGPTLRNLSFWDTSVKWRYPMRRENGRCQICKKPTRWKLSLNEPQIFVCRDCVQQFFGEFQPDSEKVQTLLDAMLLAQENSLSLGLALNVINARYSLEEAKRRQHLKNRERSGKSVDIYTVGKRMPGGFGIKK